MTSKNIRGLLFKFFNVIVSGLCAQSSIKVTLLELVPRFHLLSGSDPVYWLKQVDKNFYLIVEEALLKDFGS